MLQSLSFQFILDFFNLNQIDSEKILQRLGIQSLDEFDAILQQSLAVRSMQQLSHNYILQSTTLENNLSYLFTPFIHAVLNQNTIYIAPRQNIVEQVYTHYFRLDALELKNQQSIAEMNLCLDLVPTGFNVVEFRVYALAKALLDPACQHITIIGQSGLDSYAEQKLASLFGVQIEEISLDQKQCNLAEIDFKKLFWKRKTPELARVCQNITNENAPLVSRQFRMKLNDAAHLIDDLMYSEHLFEKLSVFGEFTETIFKNSLESKLRYANERS
ncbi:hypothetical protein AY606_07600 [Acinetobacter sp. SFB]|uniref:hypothetical protein n=1 Tax=Acinetobacter sp. SFB TaxID=1805634 RepID=UPI0007D7E445|nr:hypothetical protein [Acinetobacter sp. SFB]OAL79275.1 hypothetical protein AY606_07600 [Acinetobacter sp. SFB]